MKCAGIVLLTYFNRTVVAVLTWIWTYGRIVANPFWIVLFSGCYKIKGLMFVVVYRVSPT